MFDKKSYDKNWRKNNPESCQRYTERYRGRYPNRVHESNLRSSRKHYRLHRIEEIQDSLDWQKRNSGRRNDYQRNHLFKLRMKVIQLLGGRCSNSNCPIPPERMDKRALHIDHINGGGNKERQQIKSTFSRLSSVLKHLERYQLLCAYCNWLKRYENNEVGKNG
jgi:hypothetical protein